MDPLTIYPPYTTDWTSAAKDPKHSSDSIQACWTLASDQGILTFGDAGDGETNDTKCEESNSPHVG